MSTVKTTAKKETTTADKDKMSSENMVTAMAGTVVLGSLTLAYYTTPAWLLVTAFVGANLLQSSFTGFCPAETVFKKMGFKSACATT